MVENDSDAFPLWSDSLTLGFLAGSGGGGRWDGEGAGDMDAMESDTLTWILDETLGGDTGDTSGEVIGAECLDLGDDFSAGMSAPALPGFKSGGDFGLELLTLLFTCLTAEEPGSEF